MRNPSEIEIKIQMFRHGSTDGNLKKKYIGITDESLSNQGRKELCLIKKTVSFNETSLVYVSPLKRCIESSRILFPAGEVKVIEGLREINFGAFENKSYVDLKENRQYQAWIDSNGTLPFPDGEDRNSFIKRSLEGFKKAVRDCMDNGRKNCSFVVHGGTIMAVLSSITEKDYYSFMVKNGEGYAFTLFTDGEIMRAEDIVKLGGKEK